MDKVNKCECGGVPFVATWKTGAIYYFRVSCPRCDNAETWGNENAELAEANCIRKWNIMQKRYKKGQPNE